MHGRCRCVDKTGALKFTENCGHATRTVNVFDVVLLGRRCNLANVRKSTTKRIDIGHHKVNFAFVCSSEDVQNRIGAATHSDVECHGILKGSLISNCPRKNGFIVLLVVTLCEINDCSTCLKEQPLTVGMGCQHGAVTRKRKSECLSKAIHRISGEHARTRPTRGTRRTFNTIDIFVAHIFVAGRLHGGNEIDLDLRTSKAGLARLHGTT